MLTDEQIDNLVAMGEGNAHSAFDLWEGGDPWHTDLEETLESADQNVIDTSAEWKAGVNGMDIACEAFRRVVREYFAKHPEWLEELSPRSNWGDC